MKKLVMIFVALFMSMSIGLYAGDEQEPDVGKKRSQRREQYRNRYRYETGNKDTGKKNRVEKSVANYESGDIKENRKQYRAETRREMRKQVRNESRKSIREGKKQLKPDR
jgi:hypothetical protein